MKTTVYSRYTDQFDFHSDWCGKAAGLIVGPKMYKLYARLSYVINMLSGMVTSNDKQCL